MSRLTPVTATGAQLGDPARAAAVAAGGRGPVSRAAPASWELGLLSLVLALAVALRLWQIDLADLGYDESAAASLIAAWKLHGLFPLTGIVSSVGIVNPPAWPYLYALALLPGDGPYPVLALGILFGLVAVLLTWWLGRRWLGPWAGLAAALVYAGGFWPLVLGRTAWQPVFLQAPLMLYLDALLSLAVLRRPWALVVACGWLGIMVQLHYIAAAYALLVPLALWPARRRVRPVHVVAGAVAGLLPLLPFLVYELGPAVQLRDLRFLLGSSGGPAEVDLNTVGLLWSIAGNGGAAGLAGPTSSGLLDVLGRWSSAAQLGPLLFAAGLAVAVLYRPGGARGWLIAAWALLPAIVLTRHTLAVYFHYLYLDLPGIALGIGALAAAVAASRRRILAAAVAAGLLAYVAASVGTLAALLGYVQRADTREGGYGVPLRYNQAAGQAARAHLPAGGAVLVGGPGFKVEVLRFALGYDVPSRAFEDCREVPYAANALYLLSSDHTPGAAALSKAGAPLLARVERPGDAYLVFGPLPSPADLTGLADPGGADYPVCHNRGD